MLNLFKTAFSISNKNIILATPLILFLILLSIYLGFASVIIKNSVALILFIITVITMLGAFFAGWFYTVKISVVEYLKNEKKEYSFTLLKKFINGVGDYFLPFLGYVFLNILLITGIIILDLHIGKNLIGTFEISSETVKQVAQSTFEMKEFLQNLSVEELAGINAWNTLILITFGIFSFFTLFWVPTFFDNTKNPLKALLKSIVLLIKHPKSIILFLYVSFLHFTVSVLNGLAAVNNFAYFIMTLVYFYFIVYIVVLIFLYYEKSFIKKAESDSNSGTDSLGQE